MSFTGALLLFLPVKTHFLTNYSLMRSVSLLMRGVLPISNRMRVLAIDPGYDRCGIAVLERVKGKEQVVHSQCFMTDRSQTFPQRLTTIGTEVERILMVHKPEMVALEALYWGSNQKTAMGVAEVRGMLIYLIGKAKLPLYEYTPPQVKTGVTGDGRSDKVQVTAMVKRLVKLSPGKRHDDEYDAIALGLTCLASVRFPTA